MPLGQSVLSPKFIVPLGSREINQINWSLISPNENPVQRFLDEEFVQDSAWGEFQPVHDSLAASQTSSVAETFPSYTPTPPDVQTQPENRNGGSLEVAPPQKPDAAKMVKSKSHSFLPRVEGFASRKPEENAILSADSGNKMDEVSSAENSGANSSEPESDIENPLPDINRQVGDEVSEIPEEIPQHREFLSRFIGEVRTPTHHDRSAASDRESSFDGSESDALEVREIPEAARAENLIADGNGAQTVSSQIQLSAGGFNRGLSADHALNQPETPGVVGGDRTVESSSVQRQEMEVNNSDERSFTSSEVSSA